MTDVIKKNYEKRIE